MFDLTTFFLFDAEYERLSAVLFYLCLLCFVQFSSYFRDSNRYVQLLLLGVCLLYIYMAVVHVNSTLFKLFAQLRLRQNKRRSWLWFTKTKLRFCFFLLFFVSSLLRSCRSGQRCLPIRMDHSFQQCFPKRKLESTCLLTLKRLSLKKKKRGASTCLRHYFNCNEG